MKTQHLVVGVVGAVAFALSGTVSPVLAQQCPSLVVNAWTGQIGQEPFRVEIGGSYAYLSDAQYHPFDTDYQREGWTGNTLNVIDVSDPTGPRIVVESGPRGMEFDDTGTLSYSVGFGLYIIDVSDPTNPILVSASLEDELTPSIIVVSGTLAYLVNPDEFVIVDVSDSMNPFVAGRVAAQWMPVTVAVGDGLVLVAELENQVRIIDVSDPTNPHEVSSWPTTAVVRDLIVIGAFVYALDVEGDLRLTDVSDPVAPVDLGVFTLGGKVWGASVSGSLGAFALGDAGVAIFDVSDPRQPQPLAIYPSGGPAWDVALSRGFGYVAVGTEGRTIPPILREDEPIYEVGMGGFGGFRVVDLSNPREPVELAAFGLEKTMLDVAVKDGLEYFALGGLGIFVGPPRPIGSFPPPDSIRPGELDTPGFAIGVTPYEQYALVADMHKGLRIIDTSVPSEMVEVGFVDTPGQSHEVVVSGPHAYVADGDSGLRVIDISNPANPAEVGALDTPGDAIGIAVSDGFAYVADGEEGLRIIDVSDPAQPIEVSAPRWIRDARAVAVYGDLVFVVSRVVFFQSMTQFDALDISDPTDPQSVLLGELRLSGDPTDLALSGAFAYITTKDAPGFGPGRLDIVDISDLLLLKRVAGWEHDGGAYGVWVEGGKAYLAGGAWGVPVIDIRCLTTYWVDIVAHISGRDDSQWRSDVIINNEHRRRDVYYKGVLDDPYTVEFILHTDDGVFTGEGAIIPEGQGVFEDIVGMLGYEGKGALEIHTEVPVTIFSRVYNDTAGGTLGALAQAYRSTDSLVRWGGDAGWLYGLRQVQGEYRTNISVTNTGTKEFFASITLYGTDGGYLTGYSLKVEPGMVVQDLQPFKEKAGKPNLGWGFAKVEGAGLLASATVIDSRTGDVVWVPMVR